MFSNKPSIKIILIAVATLVGMSACNSFTNRIITSNRIDEPRMSFGYELSQTVYFNGLSIRIWNSRGLDLNFYDSNLSVGKIIEERWVGNNRAIYLNLEIIAAKDSYSEQRTAKILFDYRRGELYATSIEPLWRTGERAAFNEGDKLWLSEEEFQGILFELDK